LKKRSKKLLLPGLFLAVGGARRAATVKSFLLLFFKKERSFLVCA
jgi:hypothetical protein